MYFLHAMTSMTSPAVLPDLNLCRASTCCRGKVGPRHWDQSWTGISQAISSGSMGNIVMRPNVNPRPMNHGRPLFVCLHVEGRASKLSDLRLHLSCCQRLLFKGTSLEATVRCPLISAAVCRMLHSTVSPMSDRDAVLGRAGSEVVKKLDSAIGSARD